MTCRHYNRTGWHVLTGALATAEELGLEWPEVMIKVEGRCQALAIAIAANIQRPLTPHEEQEVSALGAGAVALLEPQARGLRPLHPEHVAALKESVREWGLLDYRWFAVLRDQHGHILSGRHRLAAARELGLR
jgi:ParB-like chromosome segregation protein Spo0J